MKLILIVILVLLLIVFVYRESSGFNIVEYEFETDKDIGTPFRFVCLSDLHDTDVTHDHNGKLLEAIKDIHPDFVILAGDMITSYYGDSLDKGVAFDFLTKLSAEHTVYYGLGNHEQRYKAEPVKFPGKFERLEAHVKKLGIRMLSNDFADIDDRNIRIFGFDVPIDNYRRVVTAEMPEGILADTFGTVDSDKYNILIAHNPDYFDNYAAFGPDLVLAGHLHGGIIGIPGIGGIISPQLKLFPKYDFGTYTSGNTTMIVSRGIGWHSIPIRIFNKAEIVSVCIRPKDRGDKNGD
ncbi:MAG: metallophosphoesterase [Lachnospiraceae bacterium]|nr:metallophosphoesterase [Lachnospiraceae bacterium]